MGSNEGAPVRMRPALDGDAEDIVRVHFAAVHTTAAGFYPRAVLESWSREPDEQRFARFRGAIAERSELILVADLGGTVVGFGAMDVSSGEVRAVYVHPSMGRRGVGGLILTELEHRARAHGVTSVRLDASVNAEGFYLRHGYVVVERGTHRLPNGIEMSCVMMTKALS